MSQTPPLTPAQRQVRQDEVKLLAVGLPEGATSAGMVCPFCGGGHTAERSFSITRTPTVLMYKCHRNKCGASGVIGSLTTQDWSKGKRAVKKFKPRVFSAETHPLTAGQYLFFANKFSLQKSTLDKNHVKYCAERASFIFPIYDIYGRQVGVVDRSWAGRVPKARTYWFNDVIKLFFPIQGELFHENVVLVEDVVSALKVEQVTNTGVAALLGTHISNESLGYLAELTHSITIALDPDALQKAISLRERAKLLFSDIKIVNLSQDPKDTAYTVLQDQLGVNGK